MKIFFTIAFAALFLFNRSSQLEDIVFDYYEGIERAREIHKPIFLFFTSDNCKNPIEMNNLIEDDKEVNQLIREDYIPILLHVNDPTKLPKVKMVGSGKNKRKLRTKGNEWAYIEITKYHNNSQPYIAIINADEELLKSPLTGLITKDELLDYLVD